MLENRKLSRYKAGKIGACFCIGRDAARMDAPLLPGPGECFPGSDIPAFLPSARQVVFLEKGERDTLKQPFSSKSMTARLPRVDHRLPDKNAQTL